MSAGDCRDETDLTDLLFIDENPPNPSPTVGMRQVTATAGHGVLSDYQNCIDGAVEARKPGRPSSPMDEPG